MSRSRQRIFVTRQRRGTWQWQLVDLGWPIKQGRESTQKAAIRKGRLAKMEYLEELKGAK